MFEYVGGFHEGFRVACDYLFSIRLSLHVTFAPDPDTLVDYRIHAGNLTSDFRRTYAENVRIFDLLLTDEAASFGVAALRRGRTLVLWRWAIREGMSGPAAWPEAVRRAGEAQRSAGLLKGSLRLRPLSAAGCAAFRSASGWVARAAAPREQDPLGRRRSRCRDRD